MPNSGQIPLKETNNHKQGKSGSETMKMWGPAVGSAKQGNPTSSGGINRPTKGVPQK